MHELVAKCSGVDRASVYRTVTLFERLSIVQKLHIGWKYKIELTDQFAIHHHHLTCLCCGKTIVLQPESLERFVETLATQYEFQPTAHQIELQGYCRRCREAQSFSPAAPAHHEPARLTHPAYSRQTTEHASHAFRQQ